MLGQYDTSSILTNLLHILILLSPSIYCSPGDAAERHHFYPWKVVPSSLFGRSFQHGQFWLNLSVYKFELSIARQRFELSIIEMNGRIDRLAGVLGSIPIPQKP